MYHPSWENTEVFYRQAMLWNGLTQVHCLQIKKQKEKQNLGKKAWFSSWPHWEQEFYMRTMLQSTHNFLKTIFKNPSWNSSIFFLLLYKSEGAIIPTAIFRCYLFLLHFYFYLVSGGGFLEVFQVAGVFLVFALQRLGWKAKINDIFYPSSFSWSILYISISLKLNSCFTSFLSTTSNLRVAIS